VNNGVIIASDYNHIERDRRLNTRRLERSKRDTNGVLIVVCVAVFICLIKFMGV